MEITAYVCYCLMRIHRENVRKAHDQSQLTTYTASDLSSHPCFRPRASLLDCAKNMLTLAALMVLRRRAPSPHGEAPQQPASSEEGRGRLTGEGKSSHQADERFHPSHLPEETHPCSQQCHGLEAARLLRQISLVCARRLAAATSTQQVNGLQLLG